MYIGYNLYLKQFVKHKYTLYKSDIISWSLSCQEMMWKHTPTLFSHFERKSACLRLAPNRVLWKWNRTLNYKQIKILSFCVSCNISFYQNRYVFLISWIFLLVFHNLNNKHPCMFKDTNIWHIKFPALIVLLLCQKGNNSLL